MFTEPVSRADHANFTQVPDIIDTPKPDLPEKTLHAAQVWITTHPQFHRPYHTETSGDKKVWKNAEGHIVQRDVKREREEVDRFLQTIVSITSDHCQTLEKLAADIAPMKPSTCVAVNVPALHEAAHMYQLLDMYTKQVDEKGKPLDPDLYEINIIVNRKFGEEPDKTMDDIERFKKDMKEKGKEGDFVFTDDGKVSITHTEGIAKILQPHTYNHIKPRLQGERIRHKNV